MRIICRIKGVAAAMGRRETDIDPPAEREALKKDYIPELSEVRMVRRAPDRPVPLCEEDASYVEGRLREVEAAFGLDAFPGVPFERIAARALIGRFIDWWRGLEPGNEIQHAAHARLPGAIRLLDTVSTQIEERAHRGGSGAR